MPHRQQGKAAPLQRAHRRRMPRPLPGKPGPRPRPPIALAAASPCALSDCIVRMKGNHKRDDRMSYAEHHICI